MDSKETEGCSKHPSVAVSFRCAATPGLAQQVLHRGGCAGHRLPCVKGAPAKRVRDCLIPTTPPSAALTPPPGLLRSPTQGRLTLMSPSCAKGAGGKAAWGIVLSQPFRHSFAVPPPLIQGRLTLMRPPCAKGAGGKAAWGIVLLQPFRQLRCAATPGSTPRLPRRGGKNLCPLCGEA